MKLSINFLLKQLFLILALALFGQYSMAQSNTLRIVYTFGPGGSGDISGRLIGNHIQKTLGIPVIVENKVGAGGSIAADTVKSAKPDGNTVLLAFMGTMVILPHTMDSLRFDPFKDFEPISIIANSPLALTVSSTTQATNLKDYVAKIKSGAVPKFFGVTPLGGLPHFLGLKFAASSGVELTAVGYKGGAQMVQALVSGEIPATYSTPADLIAMHKADKVKILAISAPKRLPFLADVPTFKEQGFDVEANTWLGLFAPKGTPSEIVARIANAVADALKDPTISQRMSEMSMDPSGLGPKGLADVMRLDYDRWGPVIKASGYRVKD
jgi:tripartite-type tricarboxylate transporter receptor subunit TctC